MVQNIQGFLGSTRLLETHAAKHRTAASLSVFDGKLLLGCLSICASHVEPRVQVLLQLLHHQRKNKLYDGTWRVRPPTWAPLQCRDSHVDTAVGLQYLADGVQAEVGVDVQGNVTWRLAAALRESPLATMTLNPV